MKNILSVFFLLNIFFIETYSMEHKLALSYEKRSFSDSNLQHKTKKLLTKERKTHSEPDQLGQKPLRKKLQQKAKSFFSGDSFNLTEIQENLFQSIIDGNTSKFENLLPGILNVNIQYPHNPFKGYTPFMLIVEKLCQENDENTFQQLGGIYKKLIQRKELDLDVSYKQKDVFAILGQYNNDNAEIILNSCKKIRSLTTASQLVERTYFDSLSEKLATIIKNKISEMPKEYEQELARTIKKMLMESKPPKKIAQEVFEKIKENGYIKQDESSKLWLISTIQSIITTFDS